MLVFSFPSFPLSPLPGVPTLGAFLFFVPSLMPCFHVTTLSPLHPMLQRFEAGVFCCGLGFGAFSIHLVWIWALP